MIRKSSIFVLTILMLASFCLSGKIQTWDSATIESQTENVNIQDYLGEKTTAVAHITVTNVPSPSVTPRAYAVPATTSSRVPTSSPVPTATATPVPTAAETPVPTATETPVPTATNAPTATPAPVIRVGIVQLNSTDSDGTAIEKKLNAMNSEKNAKYFYSVNYITTAEFDVTAFDCLIIPGGADVTPALYGEEVNGASGWNDGLDSLETA